MSEIRDGYSKLLTLVFTDLAGSTQLKTQRGDDAAGDLIRRHRELISRLAGECSGRIIDWAGDGCFLTFDVSSAGVLFALRLQQAHADQPDLPQVRVGIHLGEVTERPGPDGTVRIEGLAVDIAARIGGLARPGQVLMSSAVYHSARQRLGIETLGRPVLWQTHGSYTFKGFDEPLDISEAALEGVTRPLAPDAGDKARPAGRSRRRERGSRWTPRRITILIIIVVAIIASRFPESSPPKRDVPPSTSSNQAQPATTTPIAPESIRSLAVLPLENLSNDPNQEYFADGMTEALITELAKIKGVKVISRTSVMQYKDVKNKTMPQIARELGVDSLVEGSVLKDGNQVRITAQLIRGATDEHLWAESFTKTMENVLQLQSEIALKIAGGISATVTLDEMGRMGSAKAVKPTAYDDYLEGLYFWNQRTPQSVEQARRLFTEALELDPDFALAHVALAEALLVLVDFETAAGASNLIAQVREHVTRALELDPQLGEAYAALGALLDGPEWKWKEAEAAYLRSFEFSPGYATAHQWYAELLINLGRNDEALSEIRKAYELDPISPVIGITFAQYLSTAGQTQRASEQVEKMLHMYPGNSRVERLATITYCQLARFQDAFQLNEKRADEFKNDRVLLKTELLAQLGQSKDARELLEKTIEENGEAGSRPVLYAGAYALQNERDRAFEWLERGFRARDYFVWAIKSNYSLRSLRSDPRYNDLLRRMGLPQ